MRSRLFRVPPFRWLTLFAALLPIAASASLFDEAVTDPGFGEQQWKRLNLNRFDAVWPSLERSILTPPDSTLFGRPSGIIAAWASMAWDSRRQNIILWGGGHQNYNGNEVYLWQGDTLEWVRGSLPSQIEFVGTFGFDHYLTVDGPANSPISSHTYDNNIYLPIADRFLTFGGAAFNDGQGFKNRDGSQTGPYFWNPALADAERVGGLDGTQRDPSVTGGRMWQNRDSLRSGSTSKNESPGRIVANEVIGFRDGATAATSERGRDVVYVCDSRLWRYTVNDPDDPSQDVFEKVGSRLGRNGETTAFQGAGTYDPARNLFVKIYGGYGTQATGPGYRNQFIYWDLDNAGPDNRFIVINAVDASGQFDFSRAGEYGIDYDPVRENFALWRGDGFVWRLTPPQNFSPDNVDWTLTRLSGGGAESPPPPPPGNTGILGKWNYIPEYDLFLGLEDRDAGNIWAYKPAGWTPTFGPFNPLIFESQFELE